MALPEREPAMVILYRRRSLPRSVETLDRVARLLPRVLRRKTIACLTIPKGVALTPRG